MKTCVIMNPNAGSADQFDELGSALRRHDDLVCWESNGKGHARDLARRAVQDGFELVAAAGGDGTISEVVNGMLELGGGPMLGVIPLGTGNDLARLLALPTDPSEAVDRLDPAHARSIDAFQVETGDRLVFGINVAAGGFSGQMNEVLTAELKASWGPLAYLIGAATILPDLRHYETHVAYDDGPAERIDALNIIVANGRTAAGGRRVAPRANPEDGLLDVVIVKSGNVVELGEVAARLMTGNYLNSPKVLHRRARRIQVTSHPGMWFNVDGELLSKHPLTFEVLPAALRVIVGPDYCPEVEP